MELRPRDEKFFDLLVDQAKVVRDASRTLASGTGSAVDTALKVGDLERKGGEIFIGSNTGPIRLSSRRSILKTFTTCMRSPIVSMLSGWTGRRAA